MDNYRKKPIYKSGRIVRLTKKEARRIIDDNQEQIELRLRVARLKRKSKSIKDILELDDSFEESYNSGSKRKTLKRKHY